MHLFKHQQDIIDADPKKCGLFLGTGSGKTRIALMLASGRTLVVCPKTQKEDQSWERERDKIGSTLDLTVISKETFRRDFKTLPRFDTVILDEAHTMLGVTPNTRWRNKKPVPKASQIFEAIAGYVAHHAPQRLYLVTATPTRSPMAVWGAGRLLGRDWGWHTFRDAFYVRLPIPGREIYAPRNDNTTKDRLATAVRKIGYVGRLPDWFDVPAQTYRTDYIELTTQQKKRIKEMAIEFPDPFVRCGKIHQIENGVLAGTEFTDGEVFPNGKIEKILDYAEEFGRIVVFAKYTAQIAQIASAALADGRKVLILDGATRDRKAVLAEANASPECVLIAQAQVSAGWEVPLYPCMVFASRTYSFVDYDQALGRIQRADNIKKNIYINLVVKGGVDEAVDKCLANKKDFSERTYEARS